MRSDNLIFNAALSLEGFTVFLNTAWLLVIN